MKDLNYEIDVVLKLSYFYDEVIVLEVFTKILKLKGPVKSYWRYCDTCGKFRNHKKAAGWPEISSVKKGAGKNFQLTWLFNEDH